MSVKKFFLTNLEEKFLVSITLPKASSLIVRINFQIKLYKYISFSSDCEIDILKKQCIFKTPLICKLMKFVCLPIGQLNNFHFHHQAKLFDGKLSRDQEGAGCCVWIVQQLFRQSDLSDSANNHNPSDLFRSEEGQRLKLLFTENKTFNSNVVIM